MLDNPWDNLYFDSQSETIIIVDPNDSDPNECPEIMSRTNYGPNRSRLHVGIGEELEVCIVNRCGDPRWSIEGPGQLVSGNRSVVQVEVDKIASSGDTVTVKAKFSTCPEGCPDSLEIKFEVILPNALYMEPLTPIPPGWSINSIHEQFRVSGGFVAETYALPDSVNFYNIEFGEAAAMPNSFGPYMSQMGNIPSHLFQSPQPTVSQLVIPGKGTLLAPDEISHVFLCRVSAFPDTTILNPTSSAESNLYGIVRYDIEQLYVTEDGSLATFCTAQQSARNSGGANSYLRIRKKTVGSSVGRAEVINRLNDPTHLPTNFSFPLLNCQ
jgi:hypothetical protein